MQNVWRIGNITLERKIITFKTLALSKIVYLTLITSFSKQLFQEIQRIQKAFIWNNLTPKINHETWCNSFEKGGLKNVDIIRKLQVFNTHGLNNYMMTSFINGK